MHRIRHYARALLRDNRGLTTVEYALVLCLIAVFGIAAWKQFGETISEGVGGADEAVGAALAPVKP